MQAITQPTASLLSEQVPVSTRIEEISDALSHPELSGDNPDVIDYLNCSTSLNQSPLNSQVGTIRVTKEAFSKARENAMLRYKEKKKHRQ